MKAVILAGGLGTRISEESRLRPKPMVEIGGMPILWHIMKVYSAQGVNDFVICAGYKQHVIKEWFSDYFLHTSDVTFDYTGGELTTEVHGAHAEPWRVTVVDTGLHTNTGGRLRRVRPYVGEGPFMLTYGDAVGNINLQELVRFHHDHGRVATVSLHNFGQNKGVAELGRDGEVLEFREKSDADGDLINIGFMMLESEVFDYLGEDSEAFERGPMTRLVADGQLAGYIHDGWWQCMDTMSERKRLEELWESGAAPWKIWE